MLEILSLAPIKAIGWAVVGIAFIAVVLRYRSVLDKTTFAREVVIIATAYLAYFAVRGFTASEPERAISHAYDVVAFERALGLSQEVRLQSLIIDQRWIVMVANWTYIWGHWPFILFAALWLWIKYPETYRLYRNAFLLSGTIALAIFALYPVAPPRFIDIGVVDTVTAYSGSYRTMQPPAFVNQYAAVPSMHFGWNLLIGIALATTARTPWMRILGAVFPVFMFFAVVLTANHYVVDPLAGAIVSLVGLAGSYGWQRWLVRPDHQRVKRSPRRRRNAGMSRLGLAE